MAVSSFGASASGSNDEGGTLVVSGVVTENGTKIAAVTAAGSYTFDFNGMGVCSVYSYTSSGNGTALGVIESAPTGSGTAVFTVPANTVGFAFSGADGTVVVRKFTQSTSAVVTDTTNSFLQTGPVHDAPRYATNGNGLYVAVNSNSTNVNSSISRDGIFWEYGGLLPSTTAWSDVAYGNGIFVAVAGYQPIWSYTNAPYCATTTDGKTWTLRSMPSSSSWSQVAYGGGKFVAVAHSGTIAYSTDGITWTTGSGSPVTSGYNWFSVAYGSGKFVAVAGNYWAYSSDGINWTGITPPMGGSNWKFVAYNGTVFAIVGSWMSYTAYSTDGVNWSTGGALTGYQSYDYSTYGLSAANGKFFIKPSSVATVTSSDDGNNWTWYSTPSNVWITDVLYNGSNYIGLAYPTSAAISPNGAAWTKIGTGADYNNSPIYYVNGRYISLEQSSYYVRHSTDGLSWTSNYIPATGSWWSIAYGNGLYVLMFGGAPGANTGVQAYYTSPDLTTWTGRNLPSALRTKQVKFINNKFWVGSGYPGYQEGLYSSADGITWTNSLNAYICAVEYGKGKFVSLPGWDGYNVGYTSTDGVSWASFTTPWNLGCGSIAYGNGIFVGACHVYGTGGSSLIWSTDGVLWNKTAVTHGSLTHAHVKFYQGKFIASIQGTIYYSYDGKTWSFAKSLDNGFFPAVGPNGVIITNANNSSYYKNGSTVTIS